MMPSRSTDALFQLIRSLQKGEKRNFKLYIKRNTSSDDLKIVQLFDVLDKMNEYDEATVLTKINTIRKDQLANRKAHLYRQILSSLRLLESSDNIDIQLREQLDFARILYNKGLHIQTLKILERTKDLARQHHQVSFLMQVFFLEKKIEGLYITRSLQDRARLLGHESKEVSRELLRITDLSNLALELYGWYINNGHARNENDEQELTLFFKTNLPPDAHEIKGFYQRLYLYQCYCWYHFIRQDFLQYYRYTRKWVELFDEEPLMIEVETAHYIKGMHNLISAHFDLKNYKQFDRSLQKFEAFAASDVVRRNDNNGILVFVYLYTAKINQHFMKGSFDEGLQLVPYIEQKLNEYSLYLDRHRVLVFYYKIASLYFGSGDYEHTIEYLNKIINWKVDLRNDLQSYARLLHLIAHYELGNFTLLEYLIKSVYRYMAKMENLSVVEDEIFKFLRRSFNMPSRQIKTEFENLVATLKQFENQPHATRAFAYLDIISWLESKIYNIKVQDVIRKKFLNSMETAGKKT